MKKFIVRTGLFLALFLLVFELVQGYTRPVFGLRQFYSDLRHKLVSSKAEENKPRNPLGKPIEIRVNNMGFTSHSDFDPEALEGNFAVIGDSFVESKVCGTDNSIALLLDEMLPSTVYNFGKAGGNLNHYYEIYDTYGLEKLEKVFIVLTGANDLMYRPRKGQVKTSPLKTVNLLRNKLDGYNMYDSPNFDLIRKGRGNIVYILHDNLSCSSLLEQGVDVPCIEADIPSEHRFSDGHYTRSGNQRIADLARNWIETQ